MIAASVGSASTEAIQELHARALGKSVGQTQLRNAEAGLVGQSVAALKTFAHAGSHGSA